MPELLRHHWFFHRWATLRMLDTASSLSPEQWSVTHGASFGSVGGTLKHMCEADHVWLVRVTWDRPCLLKDVPAPADPVGLRESWIAILEAWKDWLDHASTDALCSPVSYTSSDGWSGSHPKWQALLHVVNHGTYHRGQVAHLLRQLKITPPATDEAAYWRSCVDCEGPGSEQQDF
jgi:uncharacterized damage-inducible protein DinB